MLQSPESDDIDRPVRKQDLRSAVQEPPREPTGFLDAPDDDAGSSSPARAPEAASAPRPAAPARSTGWAARHAPSLLRLAATLAILAVAVLAALLIWDFYVAAPWTRDGRIRVQVASIAPQVSGQITSLQVSDNQFVHKGDVLYAIDPFDYQVSLDNARAQLRQRAADLEVKKLQAERRQKLTDLATTPEEQQQYAGTASQAQSAFDAAQQQVNQAEVNLKRTSVRSSVNGFVTNLLMRVGDYAHEGTANISVIDTDSYWVDGYFEETKMPNICVGDRAEAQLMGYRDPILGRVDSVTRGISVSDAAPSTQGLPGVDPVYTWVRLAQRVPVRIAITQVPTGVPLVSGMTATVTIRPDGTDDRRSLGQRVYDLPGRVHNLLWPPAPRAHCIPPVSGATGEPASIPTPTPGPAPAPAQLTPGLAPGLTGTPKSAVP